ncbi:helix-turn-helix transcriptional regulator [Notoacmeibacter sp. MSK16QG-6]|uniref:ArsR/SmtB family transcription factor n=1 Tax=Notoacmeibacter sp. MSK16QG-6 TaxID=2957982 RepID=UPI0020A21AD0|nr:metalloregulator ArsR/SmtB family transcription factor [Notoacmeibacter sp. MSK16QG-6]MCP1199915.1 metalloregulator ArsR/SmtB family transcription factor [Notoacmeibacter sp. MSK16QG-6]
MPDEQILTFCDLNENIDQSANFLAALSNAKRLEILCILHSGEMNVGRLAERVQLSQSALSQHLSKLRARNIVSTRRDGQTIYYSLDSNLARELLELLDQRCTAL